MIERGAATARSLATIMMARGAAAATRRGAAVAACAAALALASGCRKSNPTPEQQGSAAPPPPVIDVAAVNALVPPELKDKLVFERRELQTLRGKRRTVYAFAAPASWSQSSKHFAHMRPTGSMSPAPRLEISTNCDGPCTPKPWELIADRVNFAPLASGKVLKDEHLAGRRTMIAEVPASAAATAAAPPPATEAAGSAPAPSTGSAPAPSTGSAPAPSAGSAAPSAPPAGSTTTHIVVAWWNDGDSNYHICTVILDDALKAAAPAFDKACQAISITGDD